MGEEKGKSQEKRQLSHENKETWYNWAGNRRASLPFAMGEESLPAGRLG
jgi:hypothetical protein